MIHNLSNSDTILSQYLMEMRDKVIQKDPLRFRNNMMRVGEIMAYEISKQLPFKNKSRNTTRYSSIICISRTTSFSYYS